MLCNKNGILLLKHIIGERDGVCMRVALRIKLAYGHLPRPVAAAVGGQALLFSSSHFYARGAAPVNMLTGATLLK